MKSLMQSSKDENQVEDIANSSGDPIQTRKSNSDDKNITTLSVGYVAIFVLLIFVVTILLLLYFFYNVMSKKQAIFYPFFKLFLNSILFESVYFVYVIFCLGATAAIYRIGVLAIERINLLACK